jgi:hypothetical protein
MAISNASKAAHIAGAVNSLRAADFSAFAADL